MTVNVMSYYQTLPPSMGRGLAIVWRVGILNLTEEAAPIVGEFDCF